MGTTSDKLAYLQDTKVAIHAALAAKGVSFPIGTPFREYAAGISQIQTASASTEWVRPAEWLAIPNNVAGVEKVSILNAVFDTDSELAVVVCSGAYTVNWGDGYVENIAAGVRVAHKYTYSNPDLNSGTVAKFGYKQCIITITPQASYSLGSIDLNAYHNSIGTSMTSDLASGFLDMSVNAAGCDMLRIGAANEYVKHAMLERCAIGEIAVSSFNSLFLNCHSLQKVELGNTSSITNTVAMFQNCYSLQNVPSFDTRSVTAMSQMFSICPSLRRVSFSDTSKVTDMSQMFNSCQSLQSITLGGTSSVTNMASMFNYCFTLRDIPVMDTSKVTHMSNLFNSCYALKDVPMMNTGLVTTMASMFNSCTSLCRIPLLDTSAVTNMLSMFQNCYSLQTIPLLNTSAVLNMGNMFAGCSALHTVPPLNTSAATSMAGVFGACYALKRVPMSVRYSFSIANAKMSANALNEMYTALPVKTGQTVTVMGNYGANGTTSDNPTIATSKGWTVSG